MRGHCRCCGVMLEPGGPRYELQRCIFCDRCDRMHGDELQLHVMRLLRAGQVGPYHALARMLIDDALLANTLLFVLDDPRGSMVRPWIPVYTDRWRVVVGRAIARDELPDWGLIVQVTLARYLPGPATRENLDGIQRDLTDAFTAIDPNVLSVNVDCRRDQLDPEHLLININTKTAAAPGMVAMSDPDVELPPDIMTRPRGSA